LKKETARRGGRFKREDRQNLEGPEREVNPRFVDSKGLWGRTRRGPVRKILSREKLKGV